jgi:hypothetical protein
MLRDGRVAGWLLHLPCSCGEPVLSADPREDEQQLLTDVLDQLVSGGAPVYNMLKHRADLLMASCCTYVLRHADWLVAWCCTWCGHAVR